MDKRSIVELTPRLQTVADLLPAGMRIADIGTDHAFLPTYLLQINRASSAIAADIRKGPLSRAMQTGEQYKMDERLQFRLCDGMIGISSEEVDAIAIAGMGGETIIHILSQSQWALDKTLVLQPMSTQPELREYLWSVGCTITREYTVREGDTLYTVMAVERGNQQKPTRAECWAGRQWQGMDDPLRAQLLERLQDKLAHALETLSSGESARVLERRAELQQLRNQLIEMEEEWTRWQK